MACPGCDLPAPLAEAPGILHLTLALPHSRGKLVRYLERAGLRAPRMAGDLVSLEVPAQGLAPCLRELGEALTAAELDSGLALFLTEGETLTLDHLPRAMNLGVMVGRAQGAWLQDVIGERRLTSHFQPIVHARDTRRVFAREALLRGIGEDGELIPPGRLFGAARDAGMMFALDRAARLKAVETACAAPWEEPVFINFNPTSVYDPQYCLRSTLQAVRGSSRGPGSFVFEVVESEHVADADHLRRILEVYRGAGFGVALDDLGAGYSSLNLLRSLEPDYVKLDRELVSGVDGDAAKAAILRGVVSIARELGTAVIAEGIERPEEAAHLAEAGVDYLQGFLFARPAPLDSGRSALENAAHA